MVAVEASERSSEMGFASVFCFKSSLKPSVLALVQEEADEVLFSASKEAAIIFIFI